MIRPNRQVYFDSNLRTIRKAETSQAVLDIQEELAQKRQRQESATAAVVDGYLRQNEEPEVPDEAELAKEEKRRLEMDARRKAAEARER